MPFFVFKKLPIWKLFSFIFAFLKLLTIKLASFLKSPHSKRKALFVSKLLKNAQPISLQEYLLIFPDACPSCSSRDWIKVYWRFNNQEQYSSSFNISQLQSYSRCLYCGHIKGAYSSHLNNIEGSWYLEVLKTHYQVNSPYVSNRDNTTEVAWERKDITS